MDEFARPGSWMDHNGEWQNLNSDWQRQKEHAYYESLMRGNDADHRTTKNS